MSHRILQVCNTDFYASKFLLPLITELQRRGHEVELVCEPSGAGGGFGALPCPVHSCRFPRRARAWEFARSIAELRSFLGRHHPDIINSHNRNASIVARVAGRACSVPHVYTAHGFYFNDAQSPLQWSLSYGLETLLARWTDYCLSQSREDVQRVAGRIYGERRIFAIDNGIDVGRFRPRPKDLGVRRELGWSPDDFVVAAVGRLVEGKGFQDLLRAIALLSDPSVKLLVIGGNISQDIHPFERQFRQLAGALGLGSRVHVTGLVDDVPSRLAAADVFALPTYWEGMPRSLLEAMAMALPAMASRVRGCREVVEDGRNGLLFQAGDVEDIARALRRLREMDASERSRLGAAARADVVHRFDLTRYVERQADLLERFLEAPA